jgi:hypothetical protein
MQSGGNLNQGHMHSNTTHPENQSASLQKTFPGNPSLAPPSMDSPHKRNRGISGAGSLQGHLGDQTSGTHSTVQRTRSSPGSTQGADKGQIGMHEAKKMRIDSSRRSIPGQTGVGVVPVSPGIMGPQMRGPQAGTQPSGSLAVNDDGMLIDEAGRLVGRRKAGSASVPSTGPRGARQEVCDDNKPIILKPGGGSVKISGMVQYRGVRQRPWGKHASSLCTRFLFS